MLVVYEGTEYDLDVEDETDAQEIMEAALVATNQNYKLAAEIWRVAVNGGENWIETD